MMSRTDLSLAAELTRSQVPQITKVELWPMIR